MQFNEENFIKALTERPETARQLSRVFEPTWLEQAELRPILQSIWEFLKVKTIPPSINTLREIFKKKDVTRYENRFKEIFDQLEKLTPDLSSTLYHLDQAREVAVSRSLQNLIQSEYFNQLQSEYNGTAQVEEIQKWLRSFQQTEGAVEMNIKEAINNLIAERGETSYEDILIKTGIEFIDTWSGGGMIGKQLAIVLGPTGHGKSIILGTIAHNVARQLEKRVLYISNELTMEEVTQRFLSKMSGVSIGDIIRDPSVGYKNLERHWKAGLDNHLKLVEILQEFDTDYLESLLAKYINLYGWKPDLIVLDFMERMKPTVSIKRDQSWNWLGYIAKDLIRLSKKGNYLIWTAGQLNRKGYDAEGGQSLTHAQGSMQHLQEASLVLAFQKLKYPNAQLPEHTELLKFTPLKARHAKLGAEPLVVEARLGHMNVMKRDSKIRTLEQCQEEFLKKVI